MPYWLVDPPQPVRVYNPHRGEGQLGLAFNSGAAAVVGSHTRRRPIRHFGGPWKVVDSTQLASPAASITPHGIRRDYYQVETQDGMALLLFWDRNVDSWFLQGIFD